MRRAHAKTEARAVSDACRHRQPHWVLKQRGAAAAARASQRSVQLSPRPPQAGQVTRTGTRNGTTGPPDASRLDNTPPPPASSSSASPRNASRMRSTTWPTEGKSMAISSAKHSCVISTSRSANDRSRSRPCQDERTSVSVLREQKSCPRTERCPLCGGTMRIKQSQTVTQVPGNPRCQRGPPGNGFALTATTLKRPKRKAADENRPRRD